jgi:hypothetical protein
MKIKTAITQATRERLVLIEEQGFGIDLTTHDEFWNECRGIPIEFEADEWIVLDQDYEELEEKINKEIETIIGTTKSHGGPHYPGCGHDLASPDEIEIMLPEVWEEAMEKVVA